MRGVVVLVLAILLGLIGWGCVIAGFVIQMVVGLSMSNTICIFSLVNHWSLWFYLGFIPLFLGRAFGKSYNES